VSLRDLDATPHAEVFDEQSPRTVRLELEAGERVPAHTHPGTDVVVLLLSGRLELDLDDDTLELQPEDVVRFSGDREGSPHAVEQSTALVVLAPAGADYVAALIVAVVTVYRYSPSEGGEIRK
jgi:quercetin dioxygenase-like cupin family protein